VAGAARQRARVSGQLIGLPLGWLNGRRGLLRVFRPDPFRTEKLGLVIAAIVLGGLCSGQLSSLIKEEGWVGAFVRYPLKATLYAVVVVVCTIVTTVIVVR
jgi:hypothetical protein